MPTFKEIHLAIFQPCAIRYRVEASTTDPRTRTGYERDNISDYRISSVAFGAASFACSFLNRGFWVEIYNDKTDELLHGPLNPNEVEVAA